MPKPPVHNNPFLRLPELPELLQKLRNYGGALTTQLVSVSMSGCQVARFISQLCNSRRKPGRIICDNGSEFTSKAMFFWSRESNVDLGFIQPGKPTQNAFVPEWQIQGRVPEPPLVQDIG